ncbi:MAG: hypothetical protein E7397_04085 [Ruminococcaceae bacterium]|nr:hypothetical protein [Oscillospiraceae bacterium]
MILNLIYGGIRSGKTTLLIDFMKRTLAKNPGDRCIYIVPDQLSYTAEQMLSRALGGLGINGIEVLTFSRFLYRFLHTDSARYLTPSGKQMLIWRAIAEQEASEHRIFSACLDKPGFAGKVAGLISEMNRYLITPEVLYEKAETCPEGLLREKLFAIADIYQSYRNLMSGRFLDSEEDYQRLAEKIRSSEEFSHIHIFLDDFSDFSPSHYAVLEALMTSCPAVHISLSMEPGAEADGVFSPVVRTGKKLLEMAERHGIRVLNQQATQEPKLGAEFAHLQANWEHWEESFPEEAGGISIFQAKDCYWEVDWLCREILKLIDEGKRYRDIRVLCGNEDAYHHIIEAVFSDYGIPYFSDRTMPITEHPIVLTVLGLFAIRKENWSYESVLQYLRCGYVYTKEEGKVRPLNRFLIDRLENYVLQYGIRGKKRWCSEWSGEQAGIFDSVLKEEQKHPDISDIEALRQEITKPLETFYNSTSGKRRVREIAEALYLFLCDIHLYEGLQGEIAKFDASGKRNEAEQFARIWNLLMSAINQTVVTSGDEQCNGEEFCEMLKNGLEMEQIAIIPSGLDRVTVSSLSRNSFPSEPITFFVGALEGCIPSEIEDDGLLSDQDRIYLEQVLADDGLELAKDTQTQSEGEMFKLYRAIFSTTERVYFSYPSLTAEGESNQPSGFLRDLRQMFPKLSYGDNLRTEGGETHFYSKKHAFSAMMQQLSNPDKERKTAWQEFRRMCESDGDWEEELSLFRLAEGYKKTPAQLSPEAVQTLYRDEHSYSVSRLNVYAECPFAYFVQYGLRAKEREIWQIHKFDLGSLTHWEVCKYCEEVAGDAETIAEIRSRWCNLTDEENTRILTDICEDIAKRVLPVLHRNREKVAFFIRRMEKTLKRAARTIRMSMIRGQFTTVHQELEFVVDISWKGQTVGMSGTIDRLDLAEIPEQRIAQLRVIDYKTGEKQLDIISIANRKDLQLAVYALAALELYKSGTIRDAKPDFEPEIAGILYSSVRDDMVSCKTEQLEQAESLANKKMRLQGMLVMDEDETLPETVARQDSTLMPGGASEFLRLALTKNGTGLNHQSSETVEKSRFLRLLQFVRKTVINLDSEIYQGRIAVCPTQTKGKSRCSFCKFKEVCLYDARLDGCANVAQTKEQAWELIDSQDTDGGKGETEHGS